MKVLQLSTFDGRFGASIAARRLHEALLARGQECDLLVSEVLSDSPRTHGPGSGFEKFRSKVRQHIDALPLKLYSSWGSNFSPNWLPSSIASRAAAFRSDVYHLHWCQANFVPTPSLPQFDRPLVWTFHDMWAFTGGCHYSYGCDRYLHRCGSCPVLKSSSDSDLSRWLWGQKQGVYDRIRSSLQIICPSNWLADVARRAPLLEGIPVHAIPNPIDTQVFKPMDKRTARRLLNLPEEGPLLLWGATVKWDLRKGFDLLDDALADYSSRKNAQPLGVVTLGMRKSSGPEKAAHLKNWKIGFLHDEVSLAALYSAVDVVALPSREENLSNMLAEALCCGTPGLAFAIGGNGDLITHRQNGYLARPGDVHDMADGLASILENLTGDSQRTSIAERARERLSAETLVPAFLEVYRAAMKRG